MSQTEESMSLNEYQFTFKVVGEGCDILFAAVDRYFQLIFSPPMSQKRKDDTLKFHPRRSGSTLMSLTVDLLSPCERFPSLEMDEKYDLVVSTSMSRLSSHSVWGILRGLETFSQLVYENGEGTFQINATVIHDFPRFGHRGVLLDTSRHFLPKKVIMQNLDAMAYNKLNVFHWHIVDDQSFPYQSRDYPDISDKGAYDPYTHVYSQEDIAEIIEFARLRGIRVIPEFDTPGHSESWGPGQPGLLTPCYKDGKPTGNFGPIDPTKQSTFDFLKGFMKELTEVFPDKYTHLGGDEVSFSCWQSNPNVQAFMTQMNFSTDYSKLEQYYMQHLLDIVGSYDHDYIIWQEVVDNGCKVRSDTVVHVWKGGEDKELAKVTAMGYKTILSSCWYLNYISYGTDWTKYYACDPHNFNGTQAQKDLVFGGELCMWGEYVDATNVISRIWPRGCAVSERLWSAESVTDASAAAGRFEQMRCRMVARGLNAEPANGPSFCPYEYQP
jgi:hexosaminidase